MPEFLGTKILEDSVENKRPWWHYVLGCGCIAVLIAMALFAGGSYWAYKQVTNSFFMDPVKVDALAAQILPGAKPVAGHDGIMGMDAFGVRMAIIGPTSKDKDIKKDELMIIVLGLADKIVTRDEARKQMEGSMNGGSQGDSTPAPGQTPGQPRQQEKVLQSETVSISVGGKPFDGEKQLVEDEKKAQSIRYLVGFKKGTGTLFCMVQGPADGFNEPLMKQFLEPIDTAFLTPLEEGKKASAPAKTDEATPSPAPGASEE